MGTISAASLKWYQSLTSVHLTQTSMGFTAASAAVTGVGTLFLTEVAVGDKIWNGTSDTIAAAGTVASIESNTALTLAAGYGGTTGATVQGYAETWEQSPGHGGAIDTTSAIASGGPNATFPDVTNAQRIAGLTDYRKIWFRNENVDDYTTVTAWIQANTAAANDTISILRGGSKSTTSTPVALTQTSMAFTAASTAVTGVGTSFTTELAPGEKIYNGTDDTESAGVAIASIESDTALTLASAYGGTTNAATQGYVAGIDQCTFVAPTSAAHADALALGTLSQNEAAAIWVKRVVAAGGLDGYDDNSYTIRVQNA